MVRSILITRSEAYCLLVAANGPPDSHAKAKEILAGLTGAFVDRIVETKGVSNSHIFRTHPDLFALIH
jgi:Protein of unknown function (DUF3759)